MCNYGSAARHQFDDPKEPTTGSSNSRIEHSITHDDQARARSQPLLSRIPRTKHTHTHTFSHTVHLKSCGRVFPVCVSGVCACVCVCVAIAHSRARHLVRVCVLDTPVHKTLTEIMNWIVFIVAVFGFFANFSIREVSDVCVCVSTSATQHTYNILVICATVGGVSSGC